MSQSVPSDETKLDRCRKVEDILKTTNDIDIGYFFEVDVDILIL